MKIIIAGCSYSGKSVLASNIICELLDKYQFSDIILISETAFIDESGVYNNIINPSNAFNTDEMDDVLTQIIEHQ